MENVWVLAAIWVGLALIATLLAIWLKISTALTEIVVGTVAQLVSDVWDDFGIVRAESRNHHRRPILILGRDCHRQRSYTDHGGQRVLPAETLALSEAAGGATGRNGTEGHDR